MDFKRKLHASTAKNNSLLCVGLDPDSAKLPATLTGADNLYQFNKAIIDATNDLVCAYKPNSAFYEAAGEQGIKQLQKTCAYIREHHPDIPILLDFKRADIGNTNAYYAQFAFDYLGVDAITINPYMGREANEPFLGYADKGIVVLCRTSNSGAGEFQDLEVEGKKLYQIVAEHVAREWNDNQNCLLVIGAPYPEELANIRSVVGEDMTFLVPGVGSQGGSLEPTLTAGLTQAGGGLIINSSREVIFASDGTDFAEVARQKAMALKEEINKYR
ncbi:MAG: orotidine-5'-phosphate decarboxylase [Patescibacteria group bacterium]